MKKQTVKPITLVLILTMLMSIFAVYPVMTSAGSADADDPTKYALYTTEAGSVAVELEKHVIDPGNVQIENAKEASGRKHVKFIPTNLVTPAPDTPAMVGFEVEFDQAGKYNMWVRFLAMTGGSDTIFIDYGATEYRTGNTGYLSDGFAGQLSEHETDYRWDRMGSILVENAGDKQKIRIQAREPGCILDKIIITKHTAYQPEGTGKLPDPAEVGKPAKMPEDRYPIPTITPPPEHPRVFFTKKDIPKIMENIASPEMTEIVKEFNSLKDAEYNGVLANTSSNYNARGLEIISAKALDYALYGNEENAKQAISAMKTYAESIDFSAIGDNTRNEGHALKTIGQVYDWCYPLLSEKDKAELMLLAQQISSDMEVGFPPDKQTIICGHGAEAQLYRDWLVMAIAAYDEYPDAYNLVMGKILSDESVAYTNWWTQSGQHSQGSCYGLMNRYTSLAYAHMLVKRMSGYELFNEDQLASLMYEWIYKRRPDGLLMIDGDDTAGFNGIPKNTYAMKGTDGMFMGSVLQGDPILKKEFLYQGGFKPRIGREGVLPTEMLLLNDISVDATKASAETLPLTKYFGSPVGEMVARTGWNMGTKSNDVVATMMIGEYNGMNHAHYDCGHFMIYYKGILANDSGWYEKHSSDQHAHYTVQSVAHNTLVIETDYNKWGNQNQGIGGIGVDSRSGKNFYWIDSTWKGYQENKENHWADVIGHEFGPDLQYPEYSYIAGDIANAYTSDSDDGVNEALRHMIFLPTGNEKNPAAFVVFDKVDTKVGGKKKAFLLHSQEEPEVSGNVTTIKRTERDYNGKLVNQTLLPAAENLAIEKIGGKDKRFWNKDQNWFTLEESGKATGSDAGRVEDVSGSLEAGWGRVEIMPKKSGKVDYMLNVMYVGNADDNSPVEKAELIETDSFAGAKIFDRVVMFNKNKARTKDAVTFTVPGGEAALKVNVAGLEAGTWKISVNGSEIDTQIASEDGGIIYFTAPAGEYTLTYASADADKKFTDGGAPEVEGVTIFFNNNFLYSDVPPTIRDGRTLIPMRALLEAMDAEVTWDEATLTATADNGDTRIVITENQNTVYVNDEPVELDVPAMIIDGRFVIPVRFVAENLGAKVSWDEFAEKVTIIPAMDGQKELGVENYIKIVKAEQSGAEANPARQIEASFDGNYGTYWGVSSDNHDAWGIYDFGRVKTLDKVMFTFMQGNVRKYKFDIEVSEDGVNYTPVITGMETSGTFKTGELEPFDLGGAKARYVKYKGYGNSVNKWNSLVEIVFTEKK
ncbi:MAG: hypothetical protein E7410_02555 [Ruminococcaceae bacterium]|nr:hypothetical protein [Oscillospiraceae bacterium]